MAEEGNIYATAWENFYQYGDELKEAFKKRAGKDNQINSEDILDFLNDISVILAFDCEEAKYFFSQENKSIPKGYDLNALKYNQFVELFGIWLQKQAETIGAGPIDLKSHEKGPVENKEALPQKPKAPKVARINQRTIMVSTTNYETNKKLWNDLLNQHKDEYSDQFKQRVFGEGQTDIAINDYFAFIRDFLYSKRIEVKENVRDEEDFFKSVNSYKRLFGIIEKYFMNEKKPSEPEKFNIKEARLSLDDCSKVMDYWFKTNENMILVEKNEEGGDGAVKKVLVDTIAKYENLIKETKNEVEQQVLQATVDTLRAKLEELEKGAEKNENKSAMNEKEQKKREEKRLRAFKEIFYFYCTQQLNIGKGVTFERLDRLSNTITIGTFRVFLKSFRLKVDHLKLLELYNKSAGSDENLSFEEFQDLLFKVALRAEIIPEPKSHQPKPEIMKDYKPTSYKNDPTYKVFKQNEAKRIEEVNNARKNAKPVYYDQTKRDAEKLEEIWEHMGLYNDGYKSLIGYVHLPFNSQEKQNFRMPTEFKYKPKEMEGKTINEIQEEVQKRNDLRKLVKDLKNIQNDFLSNYRGPVSPLRQGVGQQQEESYLKRQANKVKLSMPLPKKLTMKKVERFGQDDFTRIEEKFNPHDLIDDNDDEDNFYLAEYNIHTEKKERKTQNEIQKKKLEEYGKLKKVVRGFAVNGRYGSPQPPPRRIDNQSYLPDTEPGSYSPGNRMRSNSNSRVSLNGQGSPNNYIGSPSSVKKGPTYLDYNSNNLSPRNGYGQQNGQVGRNNGLHMSKNPSYGSMLDRVSQIEMDSHKREQQMMNNILNIQNHQLKKGLKAVGR